MIQNDSNRAQQVKQRFVREYNIKVLDEWLSGCVSFCLQENPKISNESLFQFALSQWLLADLNDVGVGALPPGIETRLETHTLTGTFPLQMQYLIDISEPAYDQWRNLHDKQLDEAEDEVQMRKSQALPTKKRRMLKLQLTDGKQTSAAMEHTPIRCLSTKLAPGVKLLLNGPIRCVNRVLFLESKNVRVLGGEVDILLISNAYENVLLRALNKPTNPNPKIDYEEMEVVEIKHRPNHSSIQAIPMGRSRAPKSPSTLAVDDVDDDSLLMGIDLDVVEGSQSAMQGITTGANNKPEQVASISTLMDDDELDDIVHLVDVPGEPEIMDQQVSSTKASQPSSQAPVSVNRMRPVYDEPPDDDDFNLMNSLEDQIQTELLGFCTEPARDDNLDDLEPPVVKKSRTIVDNRMKGVPELEAGQSVSPAPSAALSSGSMQPVKGSQEASASKSFNRFSASALFDDSMDDDCLELNEPTRSTADILSPNYTFRIGGTNLATIEQMMALTEESRAGASFVVYGEVGAVTEQPRIRKERWHLGLRLTDQSKEMLSVQLHNDVIKAMIHHDAAELMRMHKTDRVGVIDLLDTILVEFKELLQDIKCFWRVQYPPTVGDGAELPVVMESYEMNDARGTILLDKIIKENCSQLREML